MEVMTSLHKISVWQVYVNQYVRNFQIAAKQVKILTKEARKAFFKVVIAALPNKPWLFIIACSPQQLFGLFDMGVLNQRDVGLGTEWVINTFFFSGVGIGKSLNYWELNRTTNISKNINNAIIAVFFVPQSQHQTQNSSLPFQLVSLLNPWRVAHWEITGPFCSTVLVCLWATGKPDVRKPSNVLLMFNPFEGGWLLPLSLYTPENHRHFQFLTR